MNRLADTRRAKIDYVNSHDVEGERLVRESLKIDPADIPLMLKEAQEYFESDEICDSHMFVKSERESLLDSGTNSDIKKPEDK